MQSNRKTRGFSLGETLIVVAIIVALAAVAFVSVPAYLRSLTQLERDGIAKEIFIAAQNHLTMAESQGYLGKNGYGTLEADKTGKTNTQGIYYFVVSSGNLFSGSGNEVLKQMLPFASVDETVRLGGSYIIRYQKSPALVLDVFYSDPNGRFKHSFAGGEYDTLVASYREAAAKSDRRYYKETGDNSVIGWYGGAAAAALPTKTLKAPEIEIINAEKLQVLVSNPNGVDGNITLILTGETSKNQVAIPVFVGAGTGDAGNVPISGPTTDSSVFNGTSYCTVTLDDITVQGKHFAELFATLAPGENITVQAVAFNNSALSNIAYSAEKKTNSLYADLDAAGTTASIANIRHLENLDSSLSKLGTAVQNTAGADRSITLTSAVQTTDLDWKEFDSIITGTALSTDPYTYSVQVYSVSGTSAHTSEGCYHPVTLSQAISYNGQSHTIQNIRVSETTGTAAGLFGEAGSSSTSTTIENLKLKDFSVSVSSASGAGGALAGQLTNVTVNNVVAIQSSGHTTADITSVGNAGGLIGQMTGGSVQASAAALTVTSTGGNAGGLVGYASGTAFSASYSGGHTDQGEYYNHDTDGKRTTAIYNVTGSGSVGGLIGKGENVEAQYCYSTCSVSGATAGGLIGEAGKDDEDTATCEIKNSYCTGLVSGNTVNVSGNTVNAFLGSGALLAASTGNQYYSIINEVDKDGGGKEYIGPGAANVADLDASTASYNAFVGAFDDWTKAQPYDGDLATYYKQMFNLQSVVRLGWTPPAGDFFVATHYGDWPAPEIFFINTPTAP